MESNILPMCMYYSVTGAPICLCSPDMCMYIMIPVCACSVECACTNASYTFPSNCKLFAMKLQRIDHISAAL